VTERRPRRRALALAVPLSLAAITGASVTRADPAATPRRVLVAGPSKDPVTERMLNELRAMGLDPVRSGAAEGCARAAVLAAISAADADAALCADGDSIGIWVREPDGLRLRDVIVTSDVDPAARDVAAMRGAEIARASLELLEAASQDPPARAAMKPAPASPAPGPPPAPEDTPPDADRGTVAASGEDSSARRTPRLVVGGGISTLLGADASVGAFGGQVEVGVTRFFSLAARIEWPFERHKLHVSSGTVAVAPALMGLGVTVPFARPRAFMIPRVGGGAGAVRLDAEAETFFDVRPPGGTAPNTLPQAETLWSPALYGSAGLSMRLAGPVRLAVDGLFGATAHRMVVRTPVRHEAYWGRPFGAIAMRVEVLVP
jgi:hypothetical protein